MKSVVRLSICLLLLTISFRAPSALAVNKVLSLDGDGDYLRIGNDLILVPDNLTIEAWFNPTDIRGCHIISRYEDMEQSYEIYLPGDGRVRYQIVNTSGEQFWFDEGRIEINRWQHVAMTFDGSQIKGYLNGNQVGSIEFDGSINKSDIPLLIGASRDGGGFFFTRLIDEVRIWNYARTQEEIREDINQPIENPETLPNLVGYWNFDNGTAEDLSQYGNDGVLQGDAIIVEAERTKVIFVPGDYATIQEAIDAANPGDTVVVDPETYLENITISKDGITLQGSGADVTTIDGGDIGSVIKMSGVSDVTISGFTITNGLGDGQDYQGNDNGGGIAVSGCSNIVIRDNIITQNRVNGVFADGGGILISKCTAPIIIWQNSITNNQAENWGGGICIQGTSDVRIDWNDISNNDAVVGDGISLWEGGLAEGASAWIINSRIANNQGDGVYIGDNCSALIGGNRDNANDIFGNIEHAVHNDSTNDIDATYNYWGTTVEAEIRNAIWDYYDDDSKGVVNYEPWLDGAHRKIFPFAQALSLDGDGDYVEIPDAVDLQLPNSLTMEAWILQREVHTVTPYVIYKCYAYGFAVGDNNIYHFFFRDESNLVDKFIPVTIERGIWHHIAVTLNSEGIVKTYFNGNLIDTDVRDVPINVTGILNIGRSSRTETEHFDGFIDEVRIWNIARTQEDIQATMNATLQGDEPGLVGYWSVDDSTANDSSLYGNHGTLMGDAEIIPLVGTWPPPKRGDVSGNGQITTYDAALILQYVVGLINAFPADSMGSPSAIESHDYQVSLPNVETSTGKRIQVPIAINDASGLLAGGVTIKYDPTVLRAIGYGSLELLNGYYWKANTDLIGEVRFAFATTEVVTTMGQGNLLMVEFEVLPNSEGETSPLILDNVNLANSRSIKKINGEVRVIPSTFALLQNFPNPFNPDTWLPYKLASTSPVSISIYNAKGQLIRALHLGYQNAGVYVTRGKAAYWDGKDNVGEKVGSGVYFYTLRAGEFRSSRKMVIVK